MPETDKDRLRFLWQILNDFIVQFKNSIAGTYSKENSKRKEIPAGSKIRMILSDLYSDQVEAGICDKYSDEEIKKAIMLHEGDSIPGFPSIDAFYALLIPLLKDMREPAQDCITEIYSVLEELSIKILDRVCEKVPQLKQEVQENVLKHLTSVRDKTRECVDMVIDSEVGYIFTNDIEYLVEKKREIEQQKVGDDTK